MGFSDWTASERRIQHFPKLAHFQEWCAEVERRRRVDRRARRHKLGGYRRFKSATSREWRSARRSFREFLERLPVSLVRQFLSRLELLSPDRSLGRCDDSGACHPWGREAEVSDQTKPYWLYDDVMFIRNISRAKAELSALIELVRKGDQVIIAKAGKPVARLVPYSCPAKLRKPGLMSGEIWLAADFDSLPGDIAAVFGTAPITPAAVPPASRSTSE